MTGHIHIDVHGGLAGDMFIAAMLDALPSLKEAIRLDLDRAGITKHVSLVESEPVVNGLQARHIEFIHTSDNPRPTHHYSHIKQRLENSSLNPAVLSRALAIFDLLAQAEATVHGVDIDDVHFHEVADWDSQADIVGAASLIEHSAIRSWSCSALPLGSGTVMTEHGELPVPAPATTLLLKGFTLRSDAESGERITPTGAAILKYLIGTEHNNKQPTAILQNTGTGCGNKRFKTIPNIVRLLVLANAATSPATDVINSSPTSLNNIHTDTISVINFDIDDMTPEELAISCEQLRQTDGVIDLQFTQALGKKGRALYALQLMAKPEHQDNVVAACFAQTSTIGLRCAMTQRYILNRTHNNISVSGDSLPVKTVARPNGNKTSKVESESIKRKSSLSERRQLALQAERAAGGEANDDTN